MMSRNLLRSLCLAAAGAGLLLSGCLSDDDTPENIAGTWNVVCQPVNEDCTHFSITFDSAGDITDADVDGHRGAQRGTGEISNGTLRFRLGVGTVHEFTGTLDAARRSASGSMKNHDADGEQRTTPAVVSRLM